MKPFQCAASLVVSDRMKVPDAASRQIDLCRGWTFLKGAVSAAWLAGDEAGGAAVDLPHCWNAQDTYQTDGRYYRGPGAYRCTFTTPACAAATCSLVTEGFYGTGDVRLNGRVLQRIDGQYLGIDIDLTRHLAPAGEANILSVRLTNRCPRHVLPGIDDPDFILYGGLSGRAWLRIRPHLHIQASELSLTCDAPLADAPALTVRGRVANSDVRARAGTLRLLLLDPDGQTVAGCEPPAVDVEAGQWAAFTAELTVPSPRLWSVESPALYRVKAVLDAGEGAVDNLERSYGFRRAEFRPNDGFYLNGERVVIRGCNRHESMPGFGSALPAALHGEDARLIKAHGLNAVRLSHYPQHPAFLDACDRQGLLVYAELASWKSVRGHGRWLRAAMRQFEGLIRRDRHHPSIVIWGMGNESRSRRGYGRLRTLARQLDPSRPVTYAENHLYRARRSLVTGIPDVWSVNYELDAIPRALEACRSSCVLVSEFANEPRTRRGDPVAERRQIETLGHDLTRIETARGVAGWMLWCFNDYATLRKNRHRRFSGIVDAWRLPKPAALWLKARYTDDPFVRLTGDWGRDGAETRILYVISNADRVDLVSEGEVLATTCPNPMAAVVVPYRQAPLVARATRNGDTAESTLFPFGAAQTLTVEARAPADPEDAGPVGAVTVRVVDADGFAVSSWEGMVHVTLAGAGRLHALREDGSVVVARGVGRTYFTPADGGGPVRISAAAEGLQTGVLDVDCGGLQPL